MFSTILNAFQGFFSRSYWFGAFLPVASVAAIHLLLAARLAPGSLPDWFAGGAGEDTVALTLLMAALMVIAYALMPAVPIYRGFLDGTLLPDRLHDILRRPRVAAARNARDQLDAATRLAAFFDLLLKEEEMPARLAEAIKARETASSSLDETAVEAARRKVQAFRLGISYKDTEASRRLEQDAEEALLAALAKKADPQSDLALRLETTKRSMLEALRDAQSEAAYRLHRLSSRLATMAMEDPQATRIGDARVAAERYAFDVYNVDFDYLWPRLEAKLPAAGDAAAGDDFRTRLIDSRARIDFAVLFLVLTFTAPLFWLPYLLLGFAPPEVGAPAAAVWFLAIGAASPLAIVFFFYLLIESQAAFGRDVEAAIDHYRVAVLRGLHQPEPASRRHERQIWGNLVRADRSRGAFDIDYDMSADGDAA